jgi:3-hydroxyisobutyrate dehydrogenase
MTMERVRLGTSELQVSPIAFGTWSFGGDWGRFDTDEAKATIWVGAVGAGSRLKLVNNTWLAFTSEAVASSIALARRLGLGTETVVGALDGSTLVSPWQAAKVQRIAKDDYSAEFGLSLALKDVHLALQAADDGRFAALASLADEWQQAVDDGLGDQDLTVTTRALERDRGTQTA